MSLEPSEELTSLPSEALPARRSWYGDDRRRPLGGTAYDGLERRVADPLTEQDEDREPPPS